MLGYTLSCLPALNNESLRELCNQTFCYTQTHVCTCTQSIWQAYFAITFILILLLGAMITTVYHTISTTCKLPRNRWKQNTWQLLLDKKSKKLLKFLLKAFSPLWNTVMWGHCRCPLRSFLRLFCLRFPFSTLKGF